MAFPPQSIAFFIEMAVSVYLQYNFIDVVIDQGVWLVKNKTPPLCPISTSAITSASTSMSISIRSITSINIRISSSISISTSTSK